MPANPSELMVLAASPPDKLASCHPKLTRGQVWCTVCGRTERVDSADCFRHGWPKCCGYTMTIDSPDERRALASTGGEG